jgi:hypothetical protein
VSASLACRTCKQRKPGGNSGECGSYSRLHGFRVRARRAYRRGPSHTQTHPEACGNTWVNLAGVQIVGSRALNFSADVRPLGSKLSAMTRSRSLSRYPRPPRSHRQYPEAARPRLSQTAMSARIRNLRAPLGQATCGYEETHPRVHTRHSTQR